MAKSSAHSVTLRRSAIATSTLATLTLTLCGIASAELPGIVTFAAPPESTSGYLMASGYSKVITAHTAIKKVVLQPFGSSSAWPVRMNTGEVAFSQHCGYQQVLESYTGTGPFKSVGPQRNIRNVATTYGLPWAIHAVDPKVRTPADLKSKGVYVMVAHTDHVVAFQTIIKESGLNFNRDVKVLPIRSPAEGIQGLNTGRGDAMAFGLVPGLVEIKQSRGLHSLPISTAQIDKVKEAAPVWGATVVGKGQGPLGPTESIPMLEIECGIGAAAKTSTETVYEVVKAIYANLGAWNTVHPLARQTTLKKALEIFVVPFHDGAVRYYKEKGLWTPALEARQQQLLGK